MPKRPRQHQLEDESRNEFRRILPKPWVFRDVRPDYGIDGEVEIFDESGSGTGEWFFVQLKATDEKRIEKALDVRFRFDQDVYYRSLAAPVLVVRYHSPSKKFYAKWYHIFDKYYGRKGTKSWTFSFARPDLWTRRTPQSILLDLRTNNLFKSSSIPLPIVLLVRFRSKSFQGVAFGLVLSSLRSNASLSKGLVSFVSDAKNIVHGYIDIDNKKTVVTIRGVHSFTLHTSKGIPKGNLEVKYPSDVLVCLGIVLDNLGHSEIAGRIMSIFAGQSAIIKQSEIAIWVLQCLSRTKDQTSAIELADNLFENRGDLSYPPDIMLIPVYLQSLSKREIEFFLKFMQRRIERAEKGDNDTEKAVSHYNFGRYIWRTQPVEAFKHFRISTKYDPNYKKRPYFWRELAGMMFEGGRYLLASKWYKRALDLGGERSYEPLYADALLFSGDYELSAATFRNYMKGEKTIGEHNVEWYLKERVIGEIRRVGECNKQRRKPNEAIAAFDGIEKATSTDEMERRINGSLKLDGLCALAWFNRGVTRNQSGDKKGALASFLASALISRSDVEAWCNSFFLAVQLNEKLEATFIVIQAYHWNGEELVRGMQRAIEQQPPGFPKDEYINMFSKVVGGIKSKSEPVELRILGKGSQYKKVELRK